MENHNIIIKHDLFICSILKPIKVQHNNFQHNKTFTNRCRSTSLPQIKLK